MKNQSFLILCAVLFCAVLSSHLFCQPKELRDTTFKPEPAAEQLFKKLRRSMRAFTAFSFKSEYSFGKHGEEQPVAKYEMWMKKPSYFRMEAFRWDGTLTGVLLHDGQSLWEYWPDRRPLFGFDDSATHARTSFHRYMQLNVPAKGYSIKKEAGHLGSGMIWAVLDLAVFFEDSTDENAPGVLKYDGSMLRGVDTVNGEPCTILERSFNDRYFRQFLWISQSDFVPRKLRDVIGGSILEIWSDIKINSSVSNDRFHWEPPSDWVQWFPPGAERELVKPGTELPDFEFPLVTGEAMRLSKLRGKVVILNIWKLNCPPCRQEIPHLQRVHMKYENKNVLVLGLTSGNRQFVQEFLAKNNVTYPNLLTRSAADVEFVGTKLNPGGAIPLTYVLDTDGKVADAWYGFSEDDDRISKALRRLGIK